MAQYNADFWEIPIDSVTLDRISSTDGLWFESEIDQERRYAKEELVENTLPLVEELIDARLTPRQKEVVRLYFFYGKTQEDIAVILNLTQSTVSRHLFGTARDGKKVGGAIPKLRKAVNRNDSPQINIALGAFQERLAQAI